MSFDVKTAFLHARLPYDIFVKQIPGYPESDPSTVLRLLVVLYGLKQSSHEWYKLLSSLLETIGLLQCEPCSFHWAMDNTTTSIHLSTPLERTPLSHYPHTR